MGTITQQGAARARVLSRLPAFFLTPSGLLLALVPASVFAAVAFTPIAQADFWWHMAAGERFLTGQGIVNTDPYSFIGQGRVFQHQAWLAGTLFAAINRAGDVPLLLTANALLYTSAYLVVLIDSRRMAASLRAAALATFLGFLLSAQNWALRPQSFSLPLFALTLFMLRRYTDGGASRWTLSLLPLLTALWVNLHGAFVLGLAIQGLVAAGMVLEHALASRRAGGGARTGKPVSVVPVLAAGIASAAAVLVNPWGTGAYTYVAQFVQDPVHRSFSQEWAATGFTFVAGRLFFAFAAILIAALLLARNRGRPREWWLVLGFAILALTSVRNVLWFGLVAAPLLAAGLTDAGRRLRLSRFQGFAVEKPHVMGLLPLGLIMLLPIVALPWLRGALPLPADLRTLVSPDTPAAPTAMLRGMAPGRRTFHDMQYGSYLIWAAFPQQQVFRDPRFEVYSYEEWNDYGRMAVGRDAAPLLEKYRIDTLMLNRERQAGLIAVVAVDDRWEPIYEDLYTRMYRRR